MTFSKMAPRKIAVQDCALLEHVTVYNGAAKIGEAAIDNDDQVGKNASLCSAPVLRARTPNTLCVRGTRSSPSPSPRTRRRPAQPWRLRGASGRSDRGGRSGLRHGMGMGYSMDGYTSKSRHFSRISNSIGFTRFGNQLVTRTEQFRSPLLHSFPSLAIPTLFNACPQTTHQVIRITKTYQVPMSTSAIP